MRRNDGDDDSPDDTFVWEEETVETQPAQVREPESPQEASPQPASPDARRTFAADLARIREFLSKRPAILAAAGLLVLLAIVLPVVLLRGGDEPAATPAPPAAATPPPAPAAPTPVPPAEEPAFSLPEGETLRLGDEGSAVLELQQALVELGLLSEEPDGIFGEQTQAAVSEFQASAGLTPDGIVGAETAQAITEALATERG